MDQNSCIMAHWVGVAGDFYAHSTLQADSIGNRGTFDGDFV